MTFVQVLVFAFGFFGVWCWKDAALTPQAPPRTIWHPVIVGAIFILVSLALSIGFIKVG